MSAIKIIECDLADKGLLLRSLQRMGLTPIEYTTPQVVSGYRAALSNTKAEIVVQNEDLAAQKFHIIGNLGFGFNAKRNAYDIIATDVSERHPLVKRIEQGYIQCFCEDSLANMGFATDTVKVDTNATGERIVTIVASTVI